MIKIIAIAILISSAFPGTLQTLTDVIAGCRAKSSNAVYPSKSDLKQIAKIIDSQSNYSGIQIAALIKAESGWRVSSKSLKGAQGICQITPETKKWSLVQIKQTDNKSCVQDVEVCLFILNYLKKELIKAGKNTTFIHLIWAYNVGAGNVISKNWIEKPHLVWIQPKLLERAVMYYVVNFKDGIYDIDIDCPGYRYSIGKEFDEIKYKLNSQFKTIYINLEKHTIKLITNTFSIGCGREVPGKDTATPRGTFRIIWKLWYSFNEGGPFGNCAMRINYRYSSGASCYLHGTDKPWEVGSNETLGCINMSNWCAEIIFNSVEIGDWVIIK